MLFSSILNLEGKSFEEEEQWELF